jgi:hypothetical protein
METVRTCIPAIRVVCSRFVRNNREQLEQLHESCHASYYFDTILHQSAQALPHRLLSLTSCCTQARTNYICTWIQACGWSGVQKLFRQQQDAAYPLIKKCALFSYPAPLRVSTLQACSTRTSGAGMWISEPMCTADFTSGRN